MSLPDLVALLSAHNYLGLFVLLSLYVRKLSTEDSKFPLDIPPQWRSVVTGFFGLLYGILSAKAGGASVGAALLGGAVAAGASGFFDVLLTAIFAHDSAPKWARMLVFVFDDITTGGGSDGSGSPSGQAPGTLPKSPTPLPPPPAAARTWQLSPYAKRLQREWLSTLNAIAFPMLLITCALSASGCALLKSPQLPADLQAVEQCVYVNVVEKHISDPPQLIAACSQFEAQLVIDAAQALASSKGVDSITAARLNRKLAAFRDDVGVCR